MAGGQFFGVPVGNIGPRSGADFSPYLEMMRANQARGQFAAQLALQQQQAEQQRMEFEKKLAENQRQFDTSTSQRDKEFGTSTDLERQGLGLRAELGRGELAQGARGLDLREQGQRADIRLREADQTALADYREAEGERADARINLDKTKYTDERQDKVDEEDRRKRILSAATDVETNLLPYLENERSIRGEGFDVSRAARINIARQYANDPEAKAAALAKLTEYEASTHAKRVQELEVAHAEKKIDAQTYANEKARLENETYERTLENLNEAMASDPELGDLFDKFAEHGDLEPADWQRLMKNPYIREQVEFIAKIRGTPVDENEQAAGKKLADLTIEERRRGLGYAPKDEEGNPMAEAAKAGDSPWDELAAVAHGRGDEEVSQVLGELATLGDAVGAAGKARKKQIEDLAEAYNELLAAETEEGWDDRGAFSSRSDYPKTFAAAKKLNAAKKKLGL